jgi:dihydrofolate synthase/folylpolyglutamate synthase
MFQRTGPKALKYNLDNITQLMDALGNPQDSLKHIHIAGTNGKGSVSHMLASILQESGLRIGLYTSPHYKDYRERIRLDGQMIDKRYVVKFLNRLETLDCYDQLKPTFFEIGVAMAFCYFADKQVDYCVIETGLGGRLDSTNIITPILSIITNIGYDHQATLGETLPEIAGEKAGIIKQNTPVLIGEYQSEVQAVFETIAKTNNSKLYESNKLLSTSNLLSIQEIADIDQKLSVPYLQQNFRTTLAATILLKTNGLALSSDNVINGIDNLQKNTGFVGRWQQLSDNPRVFVDAAHNKEGITLLSTHLSTLDYDKLHIVLGMVGDKPLDQVLPLFPSQAKYYFAKADIPRGKPAKDLQEEAATHHLYGKCYFSIRKALASAKLSAKKNDLVLVTGSIFTVAEVI